MGDSHSMGSRYNNPFQQTRCPVILLPRNLWNRVVRWANEHRIVVTFESAMSHIGDLQSLSNRDWLRKAHNH